MKKIAVIEDEKILLKAIEIELSDAGYTVVTALDGKTGVELIKNEHPDLVLLDIIMPKMSGFEVLENIKKDTRVKDIPVIILTNLGHEDDRKKGMDLGAVDYFIKSITDLATIAGKIKKILR
jgi:two-component system alkaline phosphatase synthesis response regulator PhoP